MNKTQKEHAATYLNNIGSEKIMTDEEERLLAERKEQGDQAALNRLVGANLRYVVKLAKDYQGRGLDMDELVSEGNIGLMRAAQRYQPGEGRRLAPFAAPYIRRSIEEAIERNQSEARSIDAPIPAGSQNSISLLSVLVNPDAAMADEAAELNSDTEGLLQSLHLLNDRELAVVERLYGIGREHLTMAEIGQELGLKRERVRQIRDVALRKLRKLRRAN